MGKYILANNATASLAMAVADSSTNLVLTDMSATMIAALNSMYWFGSPTGRHVLLTLADIGETRHEVVYVSAWNEGSATLTVERGQDGTDPQSWDGVENDEARTKVEIRMPRMLAENPYLSENELSFAHGDRAKATVAGAAIGEDCEAGDYAVSMGYNAIAGNSSICIGHGSQAHNSSVAIGASCESSGSNAFACGVGTNASGNRSVAMNRQVEASGEESIATGWQNHAAARGSVVFGRGVLNTTEYTIAMGANTTLQPWSTPSSENIKILFDMKTGNATFAGDVTVDGVLHADVDVDMSGEGENSVLIGNGFATGEKAIAIGTYSNCQSDDGIGIGDCYVGGGGAEGGVAIGAGSGVNGTGLGTGLALGKSSAVYAGDLAGEDCVAVGIGATAYTGKSISIGFGDAGNEKSITIGDASNWSDGCIIIGYGYAGGGDDNSVIIGNNALQLGGGNTSCVLIGYNVNASGASRSIAVGDGADVLASFASAFGHGASCNVNAGAHLAMIPYQPKSGELPTVGSGDIATRHRSAPLTTLASGIIDLTDGTATAQIELPAGTHFFPDRIDAIITGVDTPGGSPAITVGTTAAGTDVLAATVITKNAAQQRQKISPDSDDGVSDIHISVSTAGSGTTYNCRVIVTGYLMENE